MLCFEGANKCCYTTDTNVASYIFTFSKCPAISQCQT